MVRVETHSHKWKELRLISVSGRVYIIFVCKVRCQHGKSLNYIRWHGKNWNSIAMSGKSRLEILWV